MSTIEKLLTGLVTLNVSRKICDTRAFDRLRIP